MVTHYNIIANDLQYDAFLPHFEDGNETLLGYMPFYHVAGLMTTGPVRGVLHGFTLVILTNPQLDDIINAIVKYGVSSFTGAPSIFEMLKDYEKTSLVEWKKFKVIISAADALHAATAGDWTARTGSVIHEHYGQTELTAAVMGNPVGARKIGSIGVPICSTRAAILDLEKSQILPQGNWGNLRCQAPK